MNLIKSLRRFGKERCMDLSIVHFRYRQIWFHMVKQFHLYIVQELGLLPENTWYEKFHTYWDPGEEGAITRWQQFVDEGLSRYVVDRDIPSAHSISLLSPHLAWGDISVRSVWHAAKRLHDEDMEEYMHSSIDAFLRQLIWREFAYHQLIHFPKMLHEPLREKFKLFPWLAAS